jgi:hypothetical protein
VQGFGVEWWVDVVVDVDFPWGAHFGCCGFLVNAVGQWVCIGGRDWTLSTLRYAMLFVCLEGSTSVSKC